MIEKIHYLVGPNGSGKTRALKNLCNQHNGVFIPKQRPVHNSDVFSDTSNDTYIKKIRDHSKQSPEQVAMALLREKSKLRFTVFSILSRKLGRNFSVEIEERSKNYRITSGLNEDEYEEVTISRYGLVGESSGLRELLILLTLIYSEQSKKYFIDEPELSLHPEAQRFLKNEIIRLTENFNCEFWLATHSPIFFSPESTDELKQAIFFSNPQIANGTSPNFDSLSEGEKNHLEKSLLRLDTEKWMLVHSKAALFCEGFRDKAIFNKVLKKVGLDLSRHDFSLVETGGKEDFSTLFMLCNSIDKKAFFIGDLDCLIECQLLSKFENDERMQSELSGIATNFLEYVSKNIREPLGVIKKKLTELSEDDFNLRDTENYISPHLNRIKKPTNNSKSLTLELINKHPQVIKILLNNSNLNPKVDLLIASTSKAIKILQKVGFFVISTGTVETFYNSKPLSPDDEKRKIQLFDEELNILNSETNDYTKNRYKTLIDFVSSIVVDTFDNQQFIKSEMIKVFAKIQAIILETRITNVNVLNRNPKYLDLKVSDLLIFSDLKWENSHFELSGLSSEGFNPAFKFQLASNAGITSSELIKFV